MLHSLAAAIAFLWLLGMIVALDRLAKALPGWGAPPLAVHVAIVGEWILAASDCSIVGWMVLKSTWTYLKKL
ncbi:MAG: hypothetical protein AAF907_03195 [Planctomycetota bacterium]